MLDTRFGDQYFGLTSAQARVPYNLDQLTSTCINSIKGYYSKCLEREENLDVGVDKWTTFYNNAPVYSGPQDVCDPKYFPAINRIFVIFVQPQLVVLRVKYHVRRPSQWPSNDPGAQKH